MRTRASIVHRLESYRQTQAGAPPSSKDQRSACIGWPRQPLVGESMGRFRGALDAPGRGSQRAGGRENHRLESTYPVEGEASAKRPPASPHRPVVARGRRAPRARPAAHPSHRHLRAARAAPAAGHRLADRRAHRLRPIGRVRRAGRPHARLRCERRHRAGVRRHRLVSAQDAAPRAQRPAGGVGGARLRGVHPDHRPLPRPAPGRRDHRGDRARPGARRGRAQRRHLPVPRARERARARGRGRDVAAAVPRARPGAPGRDSRLPARPRAGQALPSRPDAAAARRVRRRHRLSVGCDTGKR